VAAEWAHRVRGAARERRIRRAGDETASGSRPRDRTRPPSRDGSIARDPPARDEDGEREWLARGG